MSWISTSPLLLPFLAESIQGAVDRLNRLIPRPGSLDAVVTHGMGWDEGTKVENGVSAIPPRLPANDTAQHKFPLVNIPS